MKKALVLTLVLLGVGATVFAGAFTGGVDICVKYDKATAAFTAFDTVFDIDYTIGTFVFGLNAIFDLDTFDNLYFEVDATLGAFEIHSMLDFEPQTPAFMAWATSAKISIGGATLFGMFQVAELGLPQSGLIGAGSILGLNGTIGDVSVTAVTFFNMIPYLGPGGPYGNLGLTGLYFHFYGYDLLASWDYYERCGVVMGKPYEIPWTVQTDNCNLAWTAAAVWVDFPFTCVDVTAYMSFSCDNGFDAMGLWLANLDVGLPWLKVSGIDIDFTIQTKSLYVYWDLELVDSVCITPYLSLLGTNTTIEGIELNALLLEYSYNGLTFKAGEIFDHTWRSGYVSNGRKYYFTLDGGLSYYSQCYYNDTYDEFFGIWIDGDSCCGGAYDVYVINFFDFSSTVADTIFEWEETVAGIEVGIGTNVSLSIDMSLKTDGLQWFKICGGFTF
jgi:hypothetical protein